MTRFVQPEKIEIDANERAVNKKSQYCFFVCTTFDSFLNDLEESLEEMIDQQPHAAKYIIAMNILMDDAEGSDNPFEGNSFMTS